MRKLATQSYEDAEVVGVEEAARRLGIGVSLFRKEVLDKNLVSSIKVGKRRLVTVSSIRKYVAQATQEEIAS